MSTPPKPDEADAHAGSSTHRACEASGCTDANHNHATPSGAVNPYLLALCHGHSHAPGQSCGHAHGEGAAGSTPFSASAIAVSASGGGVGGGGGGGAAAALGASLLPFIDSGRMWVLGAADDGSARHCIKPWDQRLVDLPSVRSGDDDEDDDDARELLLFVPFTSQVVVKSICVRGGPRAGSAPAHVRMFVNRDGLDFDAARSAPSSAVAQELALPVDRAAELDHPLRAHRFQNVSSLTLYFRGSHGASFIELCYLSLRGIATSNKHHGAVEFVYEARASLADHPKSGAEEAAGARNVE